MRDMSFNSNLDSGNMSEESGKDMRYDTKEEKVQKREHKIESKDEEKENKEKFNIRCNPLGARNAVLVSKLLEVEDRSKLMSRRILQLEQKNECQSQKLEHVKNEKKVLNKISKEHNRIKDCKNKQCEVKDKYKEKTLRLDEAVKAKSRQLIEHIQRDQNFF